MGKTNLSLKQSLLALILFTAISAVIYSCKKVRSLTEEEIKNELIADAKDFFEKDILADSQIIPNDQNYRHRLAKKLLWEKAGIRKISLGDAVVIPIKFNETFQAKNENNTEYQQVTSYLVIYRDTKGIQHAEWVTQIPNNINGYTYEKFCGTTVVEEWNGDFIKAFAYNRDDQIIPVKLTESILYKEINFKRLNCYTIRYYGHNYVDGYPESDYWYENGSETYCQNESGVDYGPTGGDYGDMGSGGGGVNGTFVNPDVINNFILEKAMQDKYPRFSNLIKNLENFVKSDKKVMAALKEWSGYNENQIIEKVKFGKGPIIIVKTLTGRYGYFNSSENPNVINIDADWVRGLESANLLETQQATGFFLAVTVLHEFVHQARHANGLETKKYEYGVGFENSAFGLEIEDDGVAPYKYRFRFYKK